MNTQIPRYATEKLNAYLKQREVVIILGARQVGKTTLVKESLKQQKSVFLNLDFIGDRQRLSQLATLEVPDLLRAVESPDVIVIDEAQNVPETGQIVKGWFDKEIPCKVVLLGSSSLDLLNVAAEPLTGRNNKIHLTPIQFTEFMQLQEAYPKDASDVVSYTTAFAPTVHALLLERMVYGSYPQAILSEHKQEYLANLVNDYLFKDVLSHGLVKDQEQVLRLLQLLAHQVGSEVSINELSNTLGMSRPAVERSLELLEKSFIIFKLGAFTRNPRNEVIAKKKYFFWDTGVRNALLKEFTTSEVRSDIGALWENWVIAEFVKCNALHGYLSNIEFWRTNDGSEVDLVVRRDGKIRAYEMKWRKDKPSSNLSFSREYHTEVKVINRDNVLQILAELEL